MNMCKIVRVSFIPLFCLALLLDPEPLIVGDLSAGVIMGCFTFFGLLLGSIYMGALRLAFRPKDTTFFLPDFSSSPFDKRVVWQFEYYCRFLFLAASFTPFFRTDFISALSTSLMMLGASAGLYLGFHFLVRMNKHRLVTNLPNKTLHPTTDTF